MVEPNSSELDEVLGWMDSFNTIGKTFWKELKVELKDIFGTVEETSSPISSVASGSVMDSPMTGLDRAENMSMISLGEKEEEFVPRMMGESECFSEEHFSFLMPMMPRRYRVSDFQKIYGTETDGFSLHNMYRSVAGANGILLVIKDSKGVVFGYFTSSGLREGSKFDGNGESFVFRMNGGTPEVWSWSQKNRQFHLAGKNDIGIGSGGGFAIHLDNELHYGVSFPSETFENPCLASSEEFECQVLEVWQLVAPNRHLSHSTRGYTC